MPSNVRTEKVPLLEPENRSPCRAKMPRIVLQSVAGVLRFDGAPSVEPSKDRRGRALIGPDPIGTL